MEAFEKKLPERYAKLLFTADGATRLEEVRFRAGQPMEARYEGRGRFIGEALSPLDIREILLSLADHSIYAFEDQLKQGYFTLTDGCRVGVTGQFSADGDSVRSLSAPQALCIRIAREVRGCADPLMRSLISGGDLRSGLIVSPPGMGKTTMLRDAARQLSERGYRVAIADERGELAGSHLGKPTLNVGPRTDVADRLTKRMAIPQLLRTMSPDAIITDELGLKSDAEVVKDALRCGVCVVASAHGDSLESVANRPAMGELIRERAFAFVAVLGGRPGNIVRIHEMAGVLREFVGS